MIRLPRTPTFYIFAIPISAIAGYGYASTVFFMTHVMAPSCMYTDRCNLNIPPELDV